MKWFKEYKKAATIGLAGIFLLVLILIGCGVAFSDSGNGSDQKEQENSSSSKPQHTHTWVAQTKNVYHEATGHYENKWVEDSAAWDEDQYTEKVVCGCGAVFDNDNQWEHHSLNTDCIYGYSVLPVKTGTIHHEATGHNEQKWIQDSAAWKETVTTGYKCSGCGATKEKS